MNELINLFGPASTAQQFNQIKISIASPEKIRSWVLRRDQEARNHQLQDVQARA